MTRAVRDFALAATLVAAVLLRPARADDTGGAQRGPRVEAIVPVPPEEHERLHFFDGRAHHVVPGTVTIDRDPYVCDLDGRRFGAEDAFVAHLRTAHRVTIDAMRERFVVSDGIVHFVRQ